tara:strand:+ start:895 stop:1275 length:381 start_codon:yes stop_codon:yes gene_type:complete
MNHKEYDLQVQVCKYMDMQYRGSLYMSDTVASLKLTMGQAMRNKKIQKDGFKTPDLIIFEPRGKHHGLFIELKIKSPFKKNGELLKSDHLEGQQNTINDLNERGYYATFATGFDETKKIIDKYMIL